MEDDIKAKYLAEMDEIWNERGDIAQDHRRADDLLVDLLNELGYTEITEIYQKLQKWYA